ncbi:MAG: glycosyltransferase [Phycisphaerales bacterium]|nr:glycosyltransferase [Phycisphaerales bacterium]
MRPATPTAPPSDSPPRGPRLDAHCHSSASSGPVIAALGLIGAPESYSPPEQVYTLARSRGMDFFTLTDHDTIAGALSLAQRGFQNVIIGEEVTVHFPEDRCRLHVLVWMLTPELHEQIGALNLRADVYTFAAWLREHNLPHALAHPLYQQNRRLTRWHLDRCALLFKGFETLNGAHSGTHRSALESYLTHLTPGRIHRLVQEHNLEPHWPRIWEKARTGGSDDHALLNIGRAWTTVEAGPGESIDPREFFRRVMAGRSTPGGTAGHSTLLAHQLTTVAAHYYTGRLAHKPGPVGQLIAARFLKFAGIAAPRPSKLRLAADALRRTFSRRRKRTGPLLDALKTAFAPVLEKYPDLGARLNPSSGLDGVALGEHERMADFVADLHAALHRAMGSSAARAWSRRDRAGLLDHLASYALLESAQLPYLYSLFHQNRERRFVDRLAHETSPERPMRIMLFTDTLGDVNGVSRFIRNIADQARAAGHDFRVVTSTRFDVPPADNITNFPPVFATAMPRYEQLEIALPPIVRMLRHADRHQPDVIHISTPGPVGCIGFLAAKMLRAPMLGVYHTDFPAYIDHLFEDPSMTWACSRFMRAFYSPFRNIFTRSRDYAESLTKLGMPGHRLIPLRPGIDTDAFHPRFRDESIWDRLGTAALRAAPGSGTPIRFLYCGRVSIEKNMPLLSAAWRLAAPRLAELGQPAELILIGDGPYRGQMQKDLANTPARFLGFRHGEELSTLYASADAFIFPSITDTLGQVVIEAQASALPVIVSDRGGPKEVVRDHVTGFVLRPDRTQDWADRIIHLATDAPRRAEMSAAAHQWAQGLSIRESFDHFWRVHHEAWIEHINGADEPARADADTPSPARAPRPDAEPVE